MVAHVFVYGSLRVDAQHPMHAVLAAGAGPEGRAWLRGRLYAVSWYPGLILDDDGDDVQGELWRITDPSMLPELDAYEGCGPNDAPPHGFVRVTATATRATGERVDAWVWVYTGKVDETQRITGGDWLCRDP